MYPTSIYAITKRDHEEMALAFGQAYDVPAVALRFFNIYGSRQALSNPYTGVAAIFSGRMLAGEAPVIYEDGRQLRDFVHVADIVQACCLAMSSPAADHQVFNVGTGTPVSVLQVAELLARELGWRGGFQVLRKFRAGDIRHCFADISRIQSLLGYIPRFQFADGVHELVSWIAEQKGVSLTAPDAARELESYGLVR
jgi:dTDP-L-rhamnose 4-epimerase